MHEGRIADAVAAEIGQRGLDGAGLRLIVSGGHGDTVAFDEALRLHLVAALPHIDVSAIAIVHRPSARLCGGCAGAYIARRPADRCPVCGGEGTAVPTPERVDLVWTAPPAGRPDGRREA